jgi:hypothetical protein
MRQSQKSHATVPLKARALSGIPVGDTISPALAIRRLDMYKILEDPGKQGWPSSSLGNQRTGSWDNLTNGQK